MCPIRWTTWDSWTRPTIRAARVKPPGPVSSYFLPQKIDGPGSYDSQFDRNSGSSSRYSYVGEVPANDDTDYLFDAPVAHCQSCTTADITLPSNASITAQLNKWILRITSGGFEVMLFNKISTDEDLE
jgi:hypothetical protein